MVGQHTRRRDDCGAASDNPLKRGLLAGDWSSLIVFCAGTSWDTNRGSDQHIAGRLAERHPLLYVDPPLSPLTGRRRPELAPSLREPRLRLIRPGLARLTPVVLPAMGRSLMRPLTRIILRRRIVAAAAALGGDVRLVIAASLDDVLTVLPGARRVLYATDDFVAGAELMKVNRSGLEREERRRLAEADLVIACSPQLAEKWRNRGVTCVLVPNGVDEKAFAATERTDPATDVRLPAPIAGFVGHLSDRIDLRYLEAVADSETSVLLVGPQAVATDVARLERLLSRPNVQWTGPRPFEQLPSYMRCIKVGMVPYRDDEFNRASFPLKTLEYLAAGRPAVATDLPAIRWLDTDLVTIASTPTDFAASVKLALEQPRDSDLVARRTAFAARHGWDQRAREFEAALGLLI